MNTQQPFDGGSYAYAVGRVRALESGLLGRARFARLAEAPDEAQGLRMLREFGYGGGTDTLDGMIRRELERAQSLIQEISPDPELTGLFLLSTDAHNLKVLLKARLSAEEAAPLLQKGGVFPPDLLELCVRSGDYRPLGGGLAERLEGIETQKDPRLLSAAVDRAVFAEILDTVRRRRVPVLREYFELRIACLNRLARLRAERLGWDEKALAPMLLPLPPRREDEPGEGSALPIADDDTPAEAEGKMNRALTEILRREKDDPFGIAPLVYYLQARRNEGTALRLLFTAKREGKTPSLDEWIPA